MQANVESIQALNLCGTWKAYSSKKPVKKQKKFELTKVSCPFV